MPIPAIADGDDHVAADLPGADADPAAVRAVLDGVADQVLEDATERRLRRRQRAAGRGGMSSSTRILASSMSDCDVDSTSATSGAEGDRPAREAALPRLDPRKLENLLDHLGEPATLGAYQLAVLPNCASSS